MKRASLFGIATFALAMCVMGSGAHAGPFILSGTDADDHGFVSGGVNQDGWFFMQRVFENLVASSDLTNGNKTVVALGSSSTAASAFNSAFNLSSLPGMGWTSVIVDGTTNITNFFNGTGATNINNTGIIYMDSGVNVFGGADSSERALFTTNANAIDTFLGNGGGLFSQSNGYGWVNALLPGLTAPGAGSSGIALTPDGNAAFPGLTNADLSSGPFHNTFGGDLGGLTVLGVSTTLGTPTSRPPVIIGSSGGSVTNPDPPSGVPEPATFVMLASAVLPVLGYRRRKNSQAAE